VPDLFQTLLKYDPGHLKIVAGFWGIELQTQNVDSAAEQLAVSLLDRDAVRETLDLLPADGRAALNFLIHSNGRSEWTGFARQYGRIREMGEGRRDREKPHQNPISTSEILFYRGLLAKAFFDSGKGAQEYAYIPDDLVPLIGQRDRKTGDEILGRAATPAERSTELPASDQLLDDATTLLAALRLMESGSSLPLSHELTPILQNLLSAAKLIKKNQPQTDATKNFLEASRHDALDILYNAWIDSQAFDELRLIPGLVCEGKWTNSPRETRKTILNFIKVLPEGKWWSLPAFLNDLKEKHPDFQRPAGDYDSWFIRRESDGQFLRGFVHWDEVDGQVVGMIVQMLHMLGKADIAFADGSATITSFRLSSFDRNKKEETRISVSSNGRVVVPRLFSRTIRYQLARFCKWDGQKQDEYVYQVTAPSLQRANDQGLRAEQLLSILVKHTNGNVPPPLVKALKRWEVNGAEARVERLPVLRVSRPEVIDELRKSRGGKFLGELLSPTAVVVKDGAVEKVMAALMELGMIGETEISE
jgi:hypothetical protein